VSITALEGMGKANPKEREGTILASDFPAMETIQRICCLLGLLSVTGALNNARPTPMTLC
jgi:hypothetical protein